MRRPEEIEAELIKVCYARHLAVNRVRRYWKRIDALEKELEESRKGGANEAQIL